MTFRHPFFLAGIEEELPAGGYTVETDERPIEGLSFNAYRRVRTLIHLPATKAGSQGLTRMLEVDPNALDAAQKRDQRPPHAPDDEGFTSQTT